MAEVTKDIFAPLSPEFPEGKSIPVGLLQADQKVRGHLVDQEWRSRMYGDQSVRVRSAEGDVQLGKQHSHYYLSEILAKDSNQFNMTIRRPIESPDYLIYSGAVINFKWQETSDGNAVLGQKMLITLNKKPAYQNIPLERKERYELPRYSKPVLEWINDLLDLLNHLKTYPEDKEAVKSYEAVTAQIIEATTPLVHQPSNSEGFIGG